MSKPHAITSYQAYIILLLFFLLIITIKTSYHLTYALPITTRTNTSTRTSTGSITNNLASTINYSLPPVRYYTKCGKESQKHNPATTTALQQLNIQYTTDPALAVLYLPCGYNYLESELAILEPSNPIQTIFAVKGADQLCSKNQLWHRISQYWGRDKASQLTPETWVIFSQLDTQAFYDLPPHDHQQSIFILKKNIQRKLGLKIVHGVPAAIAAIEKDPGFRVIQRYIPHPLCIYQRKLNLRIYICIVCPGKRGQSVEWWLHPKGKCIYTADDYTPLLVNNLDNHNQHLTSFNLDSNKTYQQDGLPETLQQFRDHIGTTVYNKLWLDIISTLSGIRQSYSPPSSSPSTNSDGSPHMCFIDSALQGHRCFQLFGVDVIINTQPTSSSSNWQPLVLEFNKGPEMSFKSPEDKNMKPMVMTDCIKLGLDKDTRTWIRIP